MKTKEQDLAKAISALCDIVDRIVDNDQMRDLLQRQVRDIVDPIQYGFWEVDDT